MRAKHCLAILATVATLVTTASSQYVRSAVQIDLESGVQWKEVGSEVSGLFRHVDDNGLRVTAEVADGVTLRQVAAAIEGRRGIASVRFSVPGLAGGSPQSPKAGRKLATTLRKRYKEYLATLTPSERAKQKTSAPGAGYLDAWIYWMERRLGENADVNLDLNALYLRAKQQARAMPVSANDGSSIIWMEVGPKSINPHPDPAWTGPVAITGRFNVVEYAPGDPLVIWAGSAGGGLWKSTNGGSSWTPMSDTWLSMNISSIAVDPTNDDVVYVGTGDFPGWIYTQAGVYKTTNGGSTWTRLSATSGWRNVNDILVDPTNPSIVLAATGDSQTSPGSSVYRSTNGGTSWTLIGSGYALTRGLPFFGAHTYYAVGYSGIYRSSDQGATWTTLLSSSAPREIAASTRLAGRVFYVNSSTEQVFQSNDFGNNWTDITSNLSQSGVWRQAYSYNLHLTTTEATIGGTDYDVVYLGTTDLYRFVTNGSSWTQVGAVTSGSARFHADQHGMAIHPTNPNQGIITNDGGLYRLTYSPSTGTTGFAGLNSGVGAMQFYGAAFHPSDKWSYMGGAQDNGTFYKDGFGASSDLVVGADGGIPVLYPTNTDIMLACTQYMSQDENGVFHYYRTNDRWATREPHDLAQGVPNEMPFIAEVHVDPSLPYRTFVGGRGLYRYDISSGNWTGRLGGFEFPSKITAIATAPSNASRIYVAAGSRVFMSSNVGSTWTEITGSGGGSLPGGVIASLDVHPTNEFNVLATSSHWNSLSTTHGVFECLNSAAPSWTLRSTGLPNAPMNDIERHPDDPTDAWWVASDVGVFYTPNRGANWINSGGSSLPDVAVLRVKYVPGQNFLYATTFGRGIWRYPFVETVEPTAVSSRARYAAGSLADILTADATSYQVRPFLERNVNVRPDEVGTCSILVTTNSPVADPSTVKFDYRMNATATNPKVEVQFYDWTARKYVTVHTHNLGIILADYEGVLDTDGGTLANYVGSLLRNVRVRLLLTPQNSKRVGDYTARLDFASFTFYP